MALYTVTEQWYDPQTGYFCRHTNEFRMLVHFKLDDMQRTGDFVRDPVTGDRSVYSHDRSPTKIFTSREAAEEYAAWLRQHFARKRGSFAPAMPYDVQIREWSDIEAVTGYLDSVRDPYYHLTAEPGPTPEQKKQFRQHLGLDPVDTE